MHSLCHITGKKLGSQASEKEMSPSIKYYFFWLTCTNVQRAIVKLTSAWVLVSTPEIAPTEANLFKTPLTEKGSKTENGRVASLESVPTQKNHVISICLNK